jgi:hypothetical protein
VGLWAFVRPTDPTEKKDFLQAVGVLFAGLVGLGGLYFTWRNLSQTRQTTLRTLELTERGQITERFTRAIDQLGATNDDGSKIMESRLGGIYALERIARDSKEDQWTIMEVLTAYVRQHARWSPKEGTYTTEIPALSADIQAIITVIRRRTSYYEDMEPDPLDLHEADLREAELGGADLWEANLWEANLSGAELGGADLSVANLMGAHLERANLRGADLSFALNLTREQLEVADGDETTKLPSHLKSPKHWGVKRT